MPTFDFKCEDGHVHETICKADYAPDCPECGKPTRKVFLQAPKIGWLAMGSQKNVSPEFVDRFEKMHKEQKVKEEKFEAEHGPGEYYNRAPGS